MTAGSDDSLERVELYAQRLEALHRLIAGVAHEINNPLTSVQGLVALLEGEVEDEQARQDLQIVTAEVRRAVQIIKGLRAFAGRIDEEPQPCSLAHIVDLVTDARGYETRAKGIELLVDSTPDLPFVVAAPADLHQLVLMLLLRAEQAAVGMMRLAGSPPQTVSLTVTMAPSAVLLTVDDGGLPPAPAAEPVLRACSLGAADLGGSLSVDETPTGGTRVTLTLPAGF